MPSTNPPRKVALITGGGRGIGLGISRALAADGCDLAINGVRDEAAVADVLDELRQSGAEVIYCQGNVAEAADRASIIETVQKHYGRLHVLVNNAGVAPKVRADLLEATEESYDRVMTINLKGPYFLTQAAANWMIRQREQDADFPACIVNVASISSTVASTQRGEYCISKAGMSMATKLWAARLGEFGIPVYEVSPGVTRTDMTTAVTEKYDRLIAEGLTIDPRWGTPDDVGRATAALVRGDIPYATGQVLHIDGGMLIPRL
jgi:NAD(P)-dependent dehydrogenase (short-subunit alcohol dehydrogenase family)